jgi:hypothetical protein
MRPDDSYGTTNSPEPLIISRPSSEKPHTTSNNRCNPRQLEAAFPGSNKYGRGKCQFVLGARLSLDFGQFRA